MDRTARDLVQLLRSPDGNLRLAALRVVTALELRHKSVLEAIAASLESETEAVRIQALQGLAQLGPATAVDLVAPMLLESGAVRQVAARVLALGGAAAVPALRRQYAKADHHGKRAIASTLAEIGGTTVFDFLLRRMAEEELELAKHLTQCLRGLLGRLPAPARLAALRGVHKFLREPRTKKSPHALVGCLILLGGVSEPKAVEAARRVLFEALAAAQPEAVRRNAAISLAHLPVQPKESKTLLVKLLPFLGEKEWSPAPQHLLPLLQKLELEPGVRLALLPLLRQSPHEAVRLHVLERLRGVDKPEAVRAVVPFLSAEHPRLREAAEATLKTMPGAIGMLFALLVGSPAGETAQRVQWVLRAYPDGARKKYAAVAAEKALELFEKGKPGAEVFLDFASSAEPAALQKRVTARIESVKRGSSRERWQRLASLYELLDARNLLAGAQRYDYGLALLRASRKDVQQKERHADPSLQVLTRLARHDGAALVRALAAEKGLGAEDYYYLGFHWSEGPEELRGHGAALLEHLASRYPRHKLRRAAQHKLDLLGRGGGAA
ncbi:MAG TPA: HEAT repeat domain-containing protein [Candidatus Krumholzibacteria bacterium]|nr:HEAT repeat domain-containing protein [Candidatus Krumholzibacteria bacterium]